MDYELNDNAKPELFEFQEAGVENATRKRMWVQQNDVRAILDRRLVVDAKNLEPHSFSASSESFQGLGLTGYQQTPDQELKNVAGDIVKLKQRSLRKNCRETLTDTRLQKRKNRPGRSKTAKLRNGKVKKQATFHNRSQRGASVEEERTDLSGINNDAKHIDMITSGAIGFHGTTIITGGEVNSALRFFTGRKTLKRREKRDFSNAEKEKVGHILTALGSMDLRELAVCKKEEKSEEVELAERQKGVELLRLVRGEKLKQVAVRSERKEREERERKMSIEQAKRNEMLLESYNNTILACSVTRSFTFSYFPKLRNKIETISQPQKRTHSSRIREEKYKRQCNSIPLINKTQD